MPALMCQFSTLSLSLSTPIRFLLNNPTPLSVRTQSRKTAKTIEKNTFENDMHSSLLQRPHWKGCPLTAMPPSPCHHFCRIFANHLPLPRCRHPLWMPPYHYYYRHRQQHHNHHRQHHHHRHHHHHKIASCSQLALFTSLIHWLRGPITVHSYV